MKNQQTQLPAQKEFGELLEKHKNSDYYPVLLEAYRLGQDRQTQLIQKTLNEAE